MEGRVRMAEKKKKYCVTIVETLEVAVYYVYAESEEQAHELVSNMYYDQEIILTEENHETTEFII
jgi:hypothetical protein